MDIERLRLAFDSPELLSAASGWIEHVPFGMALVDWLRPGVLAELGVHGGDSYCAFCQAARRLALPAKCVGVDTWKGDQHSGGYGPEVLRELRAHHDGRYGHFSQLIESTFDAAADTFADGSLDLLHVDGLHTYEAVQHDLETWLPKVSRRGVVLLHDTQVRRGDFGVWKVWQELAGRYRSFEFVHGHGLGILAMEGAVEAAPGLAEFLEWAKRDAEEVRRVFATLGERIALVRAERNAALQAPSPRPAGVVLFWSDERGQFSAERSQRREIRCDGAAERLAFTLEWKKGTRYRLDPGDGPGLFLVEEMALAFSGEAAGVPALAAMQGVKIMPAAGAQRPGATLLLCTADDPQAELIVPAALIRAKPAGLLELTLRCRYWNLAAPPESGSGDQANRLIEMLLAALR